LLFFWIGLAGAAGAVARFWLGSYITLRTDSPFPWGTFVINITGSFALGFLTGAGLGRSLSRAWLVPASTGFLGAYTTFSTWCLETVRLVEGGSPLPALLNVLASAVAGLVAAALGLYLGLRV